MITYDFLVSTCFGTNFGVVDDSFNSRRLFVFSTGGGREQRSRWGSLGACVCGWVKFLRGIRWRHCRWLISGMCRNNKAIMHPLHTIWIHMIYLSMAYTIRLHSNGGCLASCFCHVSWWVVNLPRLCLKTTHEISACNEEGLARLVFDVFVDS